MKKRYLATFFLFLGLMLFAKDYNSLLQEIDKASSFQNSDFSATITIVAEKPGEEREITEAKMYRRDKEEMLRSVMIILKPEAQKGQGYLQIGENLWFYDPESRRFEHSSLRENIQGSDAKNMDFNRSTLAESYKVIQGSEGKLGKFDVWILDLEALDNEAAYARRKIWVRKDLPIVLKSEDYGFSGKLMRTAAFLNYIKINQQYIPSRFIFIDNLNPGEKTQATLSSPSTAKLADSVFSKAYLERVNR